MLDISRFLTADESHGETLTAVIANALLGKSGGDSIAEFRGNDTTYRRVER